VASRSAAGIPRSRWGIATLLGFGILVNYVDRVGLGVAGPQRHDDLGKTAGGGFWYVLRQRKVLGLTFGFAAYGYLFNLFITWLPSYLSATFHANIIKAAGYAAIA
jgi:hypothetical protein